MKIKSLVTVICAVIMLSMTALAAEDDKWEVVDEAEIIETEIVEPVEDVELPAETVEPVKGSWIYWGDTDKWTLNDNKYKSMWIYAYNLYETDEDGGPVPEWFHFDEDGWMDTGWFVDEDGNVYFLYPYRYGNRGQRMTGWQLIGSNYFYLNEDASNGIPEGALLRNTVTPDGYEVNEYGMLCVNGEPVTERTTYYVLEKSKKE